MIYIYMIYIHIRSCVFLVRFLSLGNGLLLEKIFVFYKILLRYCYSLREKIIVYFVMILIRKKKAETFFYLNTNIPCDLFQRETLRLQF